jgi:cytochrome c553
VCHGLDGIARQPDAPNLAGESPIYVARQLEAFRSGERQHPQMSIIAQGLSDEDIADLAAWYSSIKITVEMPE